jgi:hypothetical protein
MRGWHLSARGRWCRPPCGRGAGPEGCTACVVPSVRREQSPSPRPQREAARGRLFRPCRGSSTCRVSPRLRVTHARRAGRPLLAAGDSTSCRSRSRDVCSSKTSAPTAATARTRATVEETAATRSRFRRVFAYAWKSREELWIGLPGWLALGEDDDEDKEDDTDDPRRGGDDDKDDRQGAPGFGLLA